jgi:chaperone BCS1
MSSDISNKSIIVIEDSDCSLDLIGERKKKKKKDKKNLEEEEENSCGGESKVTLPGFLNFIDGLASGCGGIRIIVFTTNHIDKLDPALIQKGRMDMHIEFSYCKFEAFKVLAKNYLEIE